MKIRILTYNVHKFFNWSGSKYLLNELKPALMSLDLDFVFLQEVRGVQPTNHQEKFAADPLEHLADTIWDHFVYGKNAVYTSGHHGNAILSKFPITEWQNINLSNHPFEKRSLLLAKVEAHGTPIQLACTHLDLTHWGRRQQIRKILTSVNRRHQPQRLILGGDLNDWRGKQSEELVKGGLKSVFSQCQNPREAASFPSFLPRLALDGVFYRDIDFCGAQVLTGPPWSSLSDHLPILADFHI